jgi:putative transposase
VGHTTRSALTFEVAIGAVTVHAERLVAIEQRVGAEEVEVRDLVTGIRSTVEVGTLRGRDGSVSAEPQGNDDEHGRRVDTDQWAIARERESVIKELLTGDGELEPRVSAASATLGVARRQIYTWIARYRATTRTSALLDKRSGRRRGTVQLDVQRERILQLTIEEHYLKQPRVKAGDVYKEVNRRCAAKNLKAIARGTVLRRIRALDPETVARRRFGAKHAREKVSAAPGTFVVDNALEVMQIDHTEVDLFVVDEEYRRPIGRPWITVASDIATRMVCGFYLTLDEPSEVSGALCMAHAVLPKEAWLLERKIQAEWPVWGVPQCVHADNGSDSRGRRCVEVAMTTAFGWSLDRSAARISADTSNA